MSDREADEEQFALLPPGVTVPMKSICNDGAGHGGQDAKETDSDSDTNVEKEFDESTGMLA